ncbi:flagellar biosynthesis protein FlgN [Breznakiellaceae bacterium SP9]
MAADISPEELKQRVALIRRFKELLSAQRERFKTYLDVLDKQKTSIEQGSTDDIESHIELEEHIIADIFSIQHVIEPLETIYNTAKGSDESPQSASIQGFKVSLESLKTEASAKIEQNKELLSRRMSTLHSELRILRSNPYLQRSKVFAGSETASLIDIRG